MLSRTAENLYWMGRYMERAENMARLLDVDQRLSVQRSTPMEAPERQWQALLSIMSVEEQYAERHGAPTQMGVTAFFTYEHENPSSIWSCVRAARENARALRATISAELWECVNTTWLGLRDLNEQRLANGGEREFFDWVKERSHQFRGVVHGTMLHNDAFAFNRVGTFLERADNTARLLDTKQRILASTKTQNEASVNYYEWGGVLRSVSAFRAYHQVYHDLITPERVAELLILRADMPRSLRFCFDEASNLLESLSGGRALECLRLTGEFDARLRYSRIEDITKQGIHKFLLEVLARTADISDRLSRDFLMTV